MNICDYTIIETMRYEQLTEYEYSFKLVQFQLSYFHQTPY